MTKKKRFFLARTNSGGYYYLFYGYKSDLRTGYVDSYCNGYVDNFCARIFHKITQGLELKPGQIVEIEKPLFMAVGEVEECDDV